MLRIPKKKRPKTVKIVGAGEEPSGLDFRELSEFELIKAFNWYNYVYSTKEIRGFVEKARPKIDWNSVPHNRQVQSYVFVIKMQEQECVFPTELLERMDVYFSELEKEFPKVRSKPVEQPKKQTVGPTYTERKHIADFDELEDFIIRDRDFKRAEQTFKALIPNLPKYAVEEIQAVILPRLEEMKSKDKDVKEAYSHLKLREKKEYIAFYEFCLKHSDFITSAKKALKPRKVRVVPIEKKLKNFKYKKTEESLSLASINPEKFLGAHILWIFNSKYRELSRLESTDGFEVKGTTLQNLTSARRKKVRKPEDVKTLIGKTKAGMDREFNSLKTKENVHPGRINEDTLLLRVF